MKRALVFEYVLKAGEGIGMAKDTGVLSARVPLPFFDKVESFVKERDPEKGGRTRVLVAALEAFMGTPAQVSAQATAALPAVKLTATQIKVLKCIQTGGELCSLDVAESTGIPSTSAAKRIQELVGMGYLTDTGKHKQSPKSSAMVKTYSATNKPYTGGE